MQGVAAELIGSACQYARDTGITHLYVHVAFDNQSAFHLYQDAGGFEVIQQEDGQIARALNRPRRLLMEKALL